MSIEILNYSTILIELNKAVKMHNFYPEGHPNLDSALGKCYLTIKKLVDEQGEIKWKVDQKGFYENKNQIAPGNQDISALAKKVFFRRIKEITFTPRVTQGDIRVLLSVIRLEPEELQAKGGVEAYFAERDVMGLFLNELRYEDLRKLKKELEEKKEAEKNERAEEKAADAEKGESAESREEPPPPKIEKEEQADLQVLLDRIRKETDLLRYNDLLVRIREKGDMLLSERKYEEAFPALIIFLEHSSASSSLTEDIKGLASEALRSFFTLNMINYLVERLGDKDESFRIAIQNLLLSAGEEAAGALLNAILAAGSAVSRRHYFNAIVLFGPGIRPQVEAKLASSVEWFEARQMVSILGEFGDPESMDALTAALGHQDIRVRKEVLKSLVKIPSPRSAGMLVKALDERDESLVNQAIISLGMLRDPSAIDVLGKIALRRERFSDTQESKKEAIKALGIIGGSKAVTYLARVLSTKVWFGKKANEEVRFLAANSLAMIGSREAYDAVEQACSQSAGELYTACKRILEGRERLNERNR